MKITPTLFAQLTNDRFAPKSALVGEAEDDELRIIIEIRNVGYKLTDKHWYSPFRSSTTTYHGRIARAFRFSKKKIFERMLTYRHESVHMYQRKLIGRNQFNTRYTFDREFRLTCEVQAHREDARVLVRYKASRDELERWARERAARYSKAPYLLFLTAFDREQIAKALLHRIVP